MPKQFFPLLILTVCAAFVVYLLDAEPASGRKQESRIVEPRPQYSTSAASGVSDEVRKISTRRTGFRNKSLPGAAEFRSTSIEPTAKEPFIDAGHEPDGAAARLSSLRMPRPSLSFDGLSNFDNLSVFGVFFLPPDTIGDVGPNHYVQSVNSLVRVFDKNGNALTSPFKMSQIFAPLGTACSTRDDGEPTVLYDPLADRWLVSEYCNNFPPFRQMIAISKTGDPTGAYYIYEFVMPNVKLNDFAKFGIWPDSYYMSTEEYLGSDYSGSGVFAFDRVKMLVGDPSAGFVYFSIPGVSADRRGGFLPSDMDGLTPPPHNAPNTFASYSATEYGETGDAVRLFDFHADFANPTLSTFSERPESPLEVAAFDPTSLPGRADIGQPAPGAPLDSNSDRLMYRAAYRNFGSYESLVLNQTVRMTPQGAPYRAGVRVYRLRRSGSAYSIDEQSTIGDTESSRWIGSAAEDGQGNMAVGYNVVSDEKMPSLVYAGKLANDPPGVFRTEAALVGGTGVQTAFGFRWGDWNGMSVDPEDDCTFWMTGEYFTAESQAFSDFTWLTRIGRFKFAECAPQQRGRLVVSVISDATSQPIEAASVRISTDGNGLAPYFRQTQSSGSTEAILLSPGIYSVAVDAEGFRSVLVQTVVGLDTGTPATLLVRLQPSPLIENSSVSFAAESCSIDQAAEPGETVTLNASFRNVGRLNTRNLRITLLNSGGVTTTEPPRNFGILLPNGSDVTRPFTFTVSPGVSCGDLVTLTFRVTDGRGHLGDLQVKLPSGVPRTAFRENFDGSAPGLPAGWSTSATGAQQNWTATATRSSSAPNCAFSPDPNQIGVNELVSPVFSIDSDEAVLTFRDFYDLEATFLRNRLFDGGVLEIKIGTGEWRDILAAGGEFESGGYNGPLETCCQNPLAGRMAWSGTSGANRPAEFITTRVKFPVSAAGQSVQLRWRVGTDTGTFREGQYIDDVLVTDGYSCGCTGAMKGKIRF